MQKIQTGHVSYKAYGARVRAVEMTRGNRQGNNAFATLTQHPHVPPTLMNDHYESNQRVIRDLSVEFYKKLKLAVERGAPFSADIQPRVAVLAGNRKLAIFRLTELVKQENFGYN